MGALIGLGLGLGLLLVAWSLTTDEAAQHREALPVRALARARRTFDEAGLGRLGVGGLVAWCLGSGTVIFVVAAGVSRSQVLASAFGCLAAYAPLAVVK